METKRCIYCAEEIHIEAKKCKHCGEFLVEELKKDQKVIVETKRSGAVTCLVVLGIIVLICILLGLIL